MSIFNRVIVKDEKDMVELYRMYLSTKCGMIQARFHGTPTVTSVLVSSVLDDSTMQNADIKTIISLLDVMYDDIKKEFEEYELGEVDSYKEFHRKHTLSQLGV